MNGEYSNQTKETGTEVSEERSEKPLVLGPQKIEELIRQPIIESRVWKSKDGEWVVHKTTITDIRPVLFYKKVLEYEAKRAEFRPMTMDGDRGEDF